MVLLGICVGCWVASRKDGPGWFGLSGYLTDGFLFR